MKTLPGTLWVNRGRWNWKVKLPGETVRKNYPLRLPGRKVAMLESQGRDLAESVAWRIWEKAGNVNPAPVVGETLESAVAAFLVWAAEYYRREDGTDTGESYNCEIGLRILRQRCGKKPIDDITYHDIIEARNEMVGSGLVRETINQRVAIWKRFFSWALDNRHCSAQTKSEVWALDALKRGRTKAADSEPVEPVEHLHVKQTVRYARAVVRDMVLVQELTGMRPSELCNMHGSEIEKTKGVWLFRPKLHKTTHKGKPRMIVIGPRAQKILAPYLNDDLIFKTPTGGGWDSNTYGKAIRYALKAAAKAGVVVPDWSLNQLRHACGTRVRRRYGLAAAKAVLGHSEGGTVTDRYTSASIEREIIETASRAMLGIG
jgi:integrase